MKPKPREFPVSGSLIICKRKHIIFTGGTLSSSNEKSSVLHVHNALQGKHFYQKHAFSFTQEEAQTPQHIECLTLHLCSVYTWTSVGIGYGCKICQATKN